VEKFATSSGKPPAKPLSKPFTPCLANTENSDAAPPTKTRPTKPWARPQRAPNRVEPAREGKGSNETQDELRRESRRSCPQSRQSRRERRRSQRKPRVLVTQPEANSKSRRDNPTLTTPPAPRYASQHSGQRPQRARDYFRHYRRQPRLESSLIAKSHRSSKPRARLARVRLTR